MRNLSRRTMLIFALAGLALSVTFLFSFHLTFSQKNPNQNGLAMLVENAGAVSEDKQESFGLPARLKIPKINVDTAVESVGLTSLGAMGTPNFQSDVAWFNLGPRPGENGSAVIDGHYEIKNGKESAFDNLHELSKGDKLYVEDDKGLIITFIMRESREYDPEADASDIFVLNDGKAHLNLITCDGLWNEVSRSYPKRLVIFTDKE